jgi:hypothetical protein
MLDEMDATYAALPQPPTQLLDDAQSSVEGIVGDIGQVSWVGTVSAGAMCAHFVVSKFPGARLAGPHMA